MKSPIDHSQSSSTIQFTIRSKTKYSTRSTMNKTINDNTEENIKRNNNNNNKYNQNDQDFIQSTNQYSSRNIPTTIQWTSSDDSSTSCITLPSFQVKKDKTEEFINKILSRKKNDLKKTHHQTKPPSTITRNDKNKIFHPLFTTKKLTLISISMKTSIHTYQCGHIKIITYPPYQQQVTTKTINTKGSKQQNFSYFKCKKKTNKNQQNAVLRD